MGENISFPNGFLQVEENYSAGGGSGSYTYYKILGYDEDDDNTNTRRLEEIGSDLEGSAYDYYSNGMGAGAGTSYIDVDPSEPRDEKTLATLQHPFHSLKRRLTAENSSMTFVEYDYVSNETEALDPCLSYEDAVTLPFPTYYFTASSLVRVDSISIELAAENTSNVEDVTIEYFSVDVSVALLFAMNVEKRNNGVELGIGAYNDITTVKIETIDESTVPVTLTLDPDNEAEIGALDIVLIPYENRTSAGCESTAPCWILTFALHVLASSDCTLDNTTCSCDNYATADDVYNMYFLLDEMGSNVEVSFEHDSVVSVDLLDPIIVGNLTKNYDSNFSAINVRFSSIEWRGPMICMPGDFPETESALITDGTGRKYSACADPPGYLDVLWMGQYWYVIFDAPLLSEFFGAYVAGASAMFESFSLQGSYFDLYYNSNINFLDVPCSSSAVDDGHGLCSQPLPDYRDTALASDVLENFHIIALRLQVLSNQIQPGKCVNELCIIVLTVQIGAGTTSSSGRRRLAAGDVYDGIESKSVQFSLSFGVPRYDVVVTMCDERQDVNLAAQEASKAIAETLDCTTACVSNIHVLTSHPGLTFYMVIGSALPLEEITKRMGTIRDPCMRNTDVYSSGAISTEKSEAISLAEDSSRRDDVDVTYTAAFIVGGVLIIAASSALLIRSKPMRGRSKVHVKKYIVEDDTVS
jgi:hypothetical protein